MYNYILQKHDVVMGVFLDILSEFGNLDDSVLAVRICPLGDDVLLPDKSLPVEAILDSFLFAKQGIQNLDILLLGNDVDFGAVGFHESSSDPDLGSDNQKLIAIRFGEFGSEVMGKLSLNVFGQLVLAVQLNRNLIGAGWSHVGEFVH